MSEMEYNNIEDANGKVHDANVKGIPKSGRFWKDKKTRFATVKKSPGLKQPFQNQQKLREELKRVKSISRELIGERNAAKEAKRERRKENLKRQQENQRKAEVLQVIKNPAKIKRMKKKQLKNIKKRDTLNV